MEMNGLRLAGEVFGAGYRCPSQSSPFLSEDSSTRVALATPSDFKTLSILTPPPSDEISRATTLRNGETPKSHHPTSGTSILPREFKRKCSLSVYCDEPATSHLRPIEEEPDRESVKNTRTFVVGSPKKRVKTCAKTVLTSADVLGQELKENSPIKVDIGCLGGWCANKGVQPSACVVKPLPFRFSSFSTADKKNDILTNLRLRNMLHVIDKIIRYLEPLDLTRMTVVSKSWRRLAVEVASRQELANARKVVLTSKENIGGRSSQVAKSRNETTPRKLVSIISENRIPSPKRRGPQSPQLSPRSKRFCYYVREGQALGQSGRLEKCPRCRGPSRLKDRTATCSICQFSFCAQCRCPPHPAKQCSFVIASPSSPSPRKPIKGYAVGSQASKKALRRL